MARKPIHLDYQEKKAQGEIYDSLAQAKEAHSDLGHIKDAARNDITGDRIISRAPSEAYRRNYERIFGKSQNSS